MDISIAIFHTHSALRWLIIIASLLALGVFGYGWLAKKTFPKLGRILPAAYSGLLDLQVLLGFILLIFMGVQDYRIEHLTMMVVAAVVAHLPSRWAKAGRANLYRDTFLVILASLLFIYIGVSLLPGGWSR